ncbi:hypothetical protein J2128_001774 [Methanomicrobium sp. W14]|uniref:DUF2124 family protein n=1 Tax=Methanomicrobium sp. W14 TaxID=2817839 RepID=UPI001AE6DA75|nr:DUF2124 family protein [Methanomicrobium sp. W14]MBP2133820.1 hypothetical protein [Methanomicrobium sp. W14]
MKNTETLKGVPGILRSFKKYVEEQKLPENSQIVFYGCPGTCQPFAELISYALRKLPVKTAFVPFLNEKDAREIKIIDGIGAQMTEKAEKLAPAVIVLMGGLAMQNVPVSADDALKTISKYNAKRAGICFMSIFEEEKWAEKLDFDIMIDTKVDPVKVYRK